MLTSRQPANIPTQRHGAVGSLAVYREEEVTPDTTHVSVTQDVIMQHLSVIDTCNGYL